MGGCGVGWLCGERLCGVFVGGGARKKKKGEKVGSMSYISLINDKPCRPRCVQSYPQCRTCFDQYQVSAVAQR